MSLGQLRLARNKLLKLYHPDVGGEIEEARKIIESFNFLRDMSPQLLKMMRDSRQPVQAQAQSQPIKWAWAGHDDAKVPNSSISRSDFTDRNFIKRSMWELSRHSNEEWMIYGYDGNSFPFTVVVYGSVQIFYYMAIAMIDFQTKGSIPVICQAVCARAKSSYDLYLLYANGKFYDQNPIKLIMESIDYNTRNNAKFMRKFSRLLDELKIRPTSERKSVARCLSGQ